MKKLIIIVSLICGSFAPSVTYAQQADIIKLNVGKFDPKGELITVETQGLVCEFCARALEKVFMRRKEVSGINIDLGTKEILINLKEGQTLTDEVITKLTIDGGNSVGKITRKVGADDATRQ